MPDYKTLFTSESVTEGHPDKIADQISDAVLDAVLTDDPMSRVACETLITTGLVVIAGEITTETYVDIPRLVRERIREIGYTRAKYGFDADTCGVMVALDEQSPDIAQGVDASYEAQHGDEDSLDRVGAGDQGMMFGYASNETDELMPLPIMLAHRLAKRLADVRKSDVLPYLRPDGKSQVTVRYEEDANGRRRPVEIERVLISTQHRDGLDIDVQLKPDLIEHVLKPILPEELYDPKSLEAKDFFYCNPTGKFVIGGPMGDSGLTGRKIIVDTYGGAAPHGGGAFSGKDPTKVDRSAAYAARYVAKNVVAAGLADRCQVQVAYAIGVAHPMSVLVETFGTENVPVSTIARSRSAPADLREDCGVRPLRPRRRRLHVGADRQGRRAARCGRYRRREARDAGHVATSAETILVTGGAGFIGSHLADELLACGYRVRAFDNLTPQVHEGTERPDYLASDVELQVGDVRDIDALRRALDGVDAVIHLAARVGVGQSMYEIVEYTSANSLATAVLLEALAEKPVRKLVVASSMSVYGEGLYLAGDWTDTGLPGTIESAVISGHRAAQLALDAN